ncbi:MAG TPA: dephospho-CoA kinase [Ignavibacteriaceae bacterium]|nr:dephospho-CoA kinase [Ignavibacterium sp.]HMN25988.1 dephospho-CoA kinase [Ignavibacteriaceae bacterium]
MKIAITGNIGSGKSTFAQFAEEAGFTVLKADDISKKILDEDEKIKSLVIKEFGEKSFKAGKPNKSFLASEVFKNSTKLQKLESILHPRVIKSIEKSSAEILKSNKVVFVEAALIYEADMEAMFDYVVLITAQRDLRLARKIKAGLTEEDFINRELNQIPEDEKKKRADFIFSNDGSIEELKMKFDLLLLTLGIK